MGRTYHLDYHFDTHTAELEERHYFYVWDEQDNFQAINIFMLTKDSIAVPKHVESLNKMEDFLHESKGDKITPVARSLKKAELIPHMLTYALLHGFPHNN